jgi:hypothetical protein
MQKADLARMYRLFSRVARGLEPVATIFKKHVENEGGKLVDQVTEALQSRKNKDAGADPCCSAVSLLTTATCPVQHLQLPWRVAG